MKRLSEWLIGRQRPRQGETLAALDIGTSKIACFIARLEDGQQPRVIGIGHHLAEGVRGGLVANIDGIRRAITAAVATAEQMAGETIERVIVNVAAPVLSSLTVGIELPLNGREITDNDLQRIVVQAETNAPADSQGHPLELIHTLPVHYVLDGQKGIKAPLGMTGNVLQAQLHLLAAAFGPVRTLATAIAKCHLEVEEFIAAPYASGLSCLVEDEMDLGCTVLDIGAGTTGIGIFFDDNLVYADGLPLGGQHITSDIARGLTTAMAHAERLKTLYGSAMSGPMDEREYIDVPQIGEEEPEHANHLPRSQLIRIIQPRLEEIFEMVKAKLDQSGMSDVAGKRLVLTGGTSQLPGIREMAQRMLDKQVRLGRPLRIMRAAPGPSATSHGGFTGLAEATSGPSFATTAGLLVAALTPGQPDQQSFSENKVGQFMNRLGLGVWQR
jgi:cell division protein FtsA